MLFHDSLMPQMLGDDVETVIIFADRSQIYTIETVAHGWDLLLLHEYISQSMLHNRCDKPKVSLSCRQCQQRKKRCDKNQPCQSCTQYGIECIPISRARLPRGRHASKQNSADLRQRVARLESLTANPVDFSRPVNHHGSSKDSAETPDSAWSAISEEVHHPAALVGL